jgi:type VI secretion system secreted protein Hcp
MAFDAFLKMDGIAGESTDDKHKEWIEIISFSHSITQPKSPSVSAGGGMSAERCDHADFQLSKYMSKSDPKLSLACSNGQAIPEATLELCQASEKKEKYMEYKMENVIVTSVSPGGASQSGDSMPTMQFSLAYGKITFLFTEVGKGEIESHWDLVHNTGG